MDIFYRGVFWILLFGHFTRSQEEECNDELGMRSKRIADESITSSSILNSDHKPYYARLYGKKAWCSAEEDKSPYIQILLDEEKLITAIKTQGSSFDWSWSQKYEVMYLEKGKWTSYNKEFTGNRNSQSWKRNDLKPPVRTRMIRIYPKDPSGAHPTFRVPCLRLELHGCSAPADCKDPGRPTNGVRIGDNFSHGSQVTFACSQGFVLIGKSTSVCHRGKWSHVLPNCKATCKDPGVPTDGIRRGNTFIDGDSVEFACNKNYTLVGSPIARCLNGRWSSALPQCKASCPDPGIPQNGQRVGTSSEHGKHVQFMCKSGFWLVGSQLIVCNEGKWSNDIPKCKAVCSDPGVPLNGKRIGNDFSDGQMVAYRCNPNFNLVGASTVFCVAGQWNATRPTCKASCSDPGTPQHGRRIGSNFGHGSQVTFVCLSKYSLEGSQSMTCHDGKWSSVLPVCKASCKDPGSPQNGVRHGNDFGHNKQVSFRCLPGFQLTGSPVAVCINGKWSASLPRCKAICPDPGIPVNGSRIGNSFLDSQTVAFRCQAGYTLIGSQVIRCVAGKWNKDAPECKAPCADPVIPLHGRVLNSTPDNRHGVRVKFACDPGFKMEGPSTIRCNNGKWNSPAPLCKDIDECAGGMSNCHVNAVCKNTLGSYTCTCKAGSIGDGRTCLKLCKDPGIPANGARKGDNFQHGKRISFTCNNGYTLIGNRSMTCQDGQWTSALPRCKKNCADPGTPQNGRRKGSDFGHGKKVTFLCQPRFKLIGVGGITCLDGIWSDRVPECTALCKDPGIPRYGARKGRNFEHGKTVNFTCNDGYTLVGSKTIECRNGIWSSALPQCKNFCANPGTPQNGRRIGRDFRHGKTVTFSCQPGFKLNGVNNITCNDGKWSNKVPVCTAMCKDPGIPLHGARNGNIFENGKTVSFTCNPGYTLVGSKTIECRKGIWSSQLPQCKKNCADPGIPRNGGRRGSDFRHGKRVSFLCQPGFKLSGVSSITCDNGKWSDKAPVCRALCKIPAKLNNGFIITDKFDNKGVIELSCHHGYTLIGSPVLRCVSGQWNDSIPHCRKDACPNPPNLPHGSHDGNDFSFGNSVTYTCDKQYVLEGNTVITCVAGQWVGQVPVCRAPCPPPSVPKNGFVFGPNLQHQSSVQYWCSKGFVLRGSPVSQCNDGQWDAPTPVCEVTCPDPANINHGSYSGSDFSEGGTVTYTCDDQYFLDGPSSITCLNGRWTQSPPVCRAPCSAPVAPVNGFVFGGNHQHHGTIEFWCKQGFTLRGAKFSKCVDGKWDAPRPVCEGPVSSSSCRRPPIPMNARMLEAQAHRNWFQDGERVYYKCKPGYSPSGFSIRRCSKGVWSSLAFRCNAKSCGHPGTPVNGQLNSYLFTYNSTVTYSCNQGYTLVGSKARVCQANQTWSGTLPQCTTINCGPLPVPAHGEKTTETSTFLHGQVTFRCIGLQFKLVGSSTRTCLASGMWSGQQPTCQLIYCNDPGTVVNSVRTVRKGFFYLGSVEYRCNSNYKLDGVSRIYCKRDGNWSRPKPRCLAPCSNPGTPRNGRLTGSDFRHGGTVRFYCNSRYRLVGSKTLKCNNGRWSGVKPRCKPRKGPRGNR